MGVYGSGLGLGTSSTEAGIGDSGQTAGISRGSHHPLTTRQKTTTSSSLLLFAAEGQAADACVKRGRRRVVDAEQHITARSDDAKFRTAVVAGCSQPSQAGATNKSEMMTGKKQNSDSSGSSRKTKEK